MLRPDTKIGIRCHKIDRYEKDLYNKLSDIIDGNNVFFLMDNRHCTGLNVDLKKYNIISFDSSHLNITDGIYGSFNQNWAWQCGDYFYYALMKKSDFDFMWLIEGDVYASTEAWSSIFKCVCDDETDFLAYNLSPLSDDWFWSKPLKKWYPSGYKCSFPVTRISYRAVKFAYDRRVYINGQCVKNNLKLPNDEGFIPSAISSGGYSSARLNEISQVDSSKFSTVLTIPRELCVSQMKIYHSSLFFSDFVNKLQNRSELNGYKYFDQNMDFAFDLRSDRDLKINYLSRLISEGSKEVSFRASRWSSMRIN